MPMRDELDAMIRAQRRKYQAANNPEETLHELRLCHRMQVLRYRAYGAFLAAQDGLMHLFDVATGRWTEWKTITMVPEVR